MTTSAPSPKLRSTLGQPSSRSKGFISELRRVMPCGASNAEALTYAELLLTHPHPPAAMKVLRDALRLCTSQGRTVRDRAERLRIAAARAHESRHLNAALGSLRLLLLELAQCADDMPARRLLVINAHLSEAKAQPLQVTTVLPVLGEGAAAKAQADLVEATRRHLGAACLVALREPTRATPFAAWTVEDVDAALLCLRLSYCVFQCGVAGCSLDSTALLDDFKHCGQPLWNELVQARELLRAGGMNGDPLGEPVWHELAQSRVLLMLQARVKPTLREGGQISVAAAEHPANKSMLVVCRAPIQRSTDRYDKDEVDRHLVLEQPLPLAQLPTMAALRVMQRRLMDEFPWAGDVLAIIFGELNGQAALGVRVLGLPPTLLVGEPGSGKSRLARRIADELGVPRLDLPLGGTSDTKVLGGTSRGWASGKPSDLATLMATRRSASAIVLLDELDKAADYQREGSGLQSYLLALLEPETASRHTDVFLKTSCDYSGVLWLATANRLTPIAAPLQSRMRVLKLDQPEPKHFPTIAENVIAETAQRWNLDRWVMPEARELDLPWDRITSARQLRIATEQAVASWARAVTRH